MAEQERMSTAGPPRASDAAVEELEGMDQVQPSPPPPGTSDAAVEELKGMDQVEPSPPPPRTSDAAVEEFEGMDQVEPSPPPPRTSDAAVEELKGMDQVEPSPPPPRTSDAAVEEPRIMDRVRPSPPPVSGSYNPVGGVGTWPAGRMRGPAMPGSHLGSGMTLAAMAPIPQARPVPVLQPPYAFQVPRKRINNPADIERFQQSEAGKTFIGFIVGLGDSVVGMKISDSCLESPLIMTIMRILGEMNEWVDELPPRQQPARYGNLAFRDWQGRLEQAGPDLMKEMLPEHLQEAVVELFPYFADSFGNATRIDYGTGHEVNFAAFLLCLARLDLVKQDDYQAIVLRVFVKYLDLMRKLQTTYWLEPAGSHGVWGLDDYHFLPFIFGAAQLVDHKYMKPKSIHNQDIVDNFAKDYFYLGCIQFVKKVKKGPLAEHSPMIDDISGVMSWRKVYGGMLKMYKAEVLEKVPIMQHFLFGSFIPW